VYALGVCEAPALGAVIVDSLQVSDLLKSSKERNLFEKRGKEKEGKRIQEGHANNNTSGKKNKKRGKGSLKTQAATGK